MKTTGVALCSGRTSGLAHIPVLEVPVDPLKAVAADFWTPAFIRGMKHSFADTFALTGVKLAITER